MKNSKSVKPRKDWENKFEDSIKKGIKPEMDAGDFDYTKSYWNYHIMAHKDPNGEITFAVHEVYYENNIPKGYTENPIAARGDSIKEVNKDLQMMLKDAKNKPVLWAGDDFPNEYFNTFLSSKRDSKIFYSALMHPDQPNAKLLKAAGKKDFKQILKKATKKNIHKETKIGKPVGKEKY